MLIAYLNRSFDERARNFATLFTVVDRALEAGNNEQLALGLGAIVAIAKTNPLDGLINYSDFQARLNDPNHKWQF